MTKGKQPRLSAKASKLQLSFKGSFLSKTARKLAQKQPPFKDSVTAHWSMKGSAQDLSRIKLHAEARDIFRLRAKGVVGERSICCEAHAVRRGGMYGSENAGLSSVQ